MTPEEADALLRGLCKFVDTYEDCRGDMPMALDTVARRAFLMSNQGAIARNDRSVVTLAVETTRGIHDLERNGGTHD